MKFAYKQMIVHENNDKSFHFWCVDGLGRSVNPKEVNRTEYLESKLPVLKVDTRKNPKKEETETTNQRQLKNKIAMWIVILLTMYIVILYFK